MIAVACAIPLDDKPKSQLASKPATPLVDSKSPTSLKQQLPAVKPASDNHSLHKRETQKVAQPQQSAVAPKTSTDVKKVAAPAVDASKKIQRPNRETPKSTPTVDATTQLKKTDNAPVKQSAPVPAQNSRKTRDTATAAKTVATDVKVSQPAKVDNVKVSPPAQKARVPLTSTNTRNRRDTPIPADQSKIVPSGTSTGQNPTLKKAKDTPTASSASQILKPKRDTIGSLPSSSSSNNQATGIRRPAPVDQVLKHKVAEAPAAAVTQA